MTSNSSLALFNPSGSMSLILTVIFSFVIFVGILTMWSNLKQKISDELSARVCKIVNNLNSNNNTPEIEKTLIEKISAHISEVNDNYTAEINKIKNEIYSVTTEVKNEINNKIADELSAHDIKITNELSAHLSETFTAELGKINNKLNDNEEINAELSKINTELNSKLTTEITKINLRDADYASEAQRILSKVNNVTTRLDNIEEACRNDFGSISSEFTSIKTSIEALRNEIIQRYAIAQRLQVEFDQLNENQSEDSNRSRGSSSSDSSLEENRNRFKHIFNLKKEKGDTMDYTFETVRREINELTGERIGKSTVKSFYYGEGNPKFNTVMLIMQWVDSKEIVSLDNNLDNQE